MTADKVVEVCKLYNNRLRHLEAPNSRIAHVRDRMLPLTCEFAQAGRIEKAFRWLGFVQGVLWCEGIYSIDQMKEHNRPQGEEDNAKVQKQA